MVLLSPTSIGPASSAGLKVRMNWLPSQQILQDMYIYIYMNLVMCLMLMLNMKSFVIWETWDVKWSYIAWFLRIQNVEFLRCPAKIMKKHFMPSLCFRGHKLCHAQLINIRGLTSSCFFSFLFIFWKFS